MFSGWVGEILKEIVDANNVPIDMPDDLLRQDLSHIEYADWFFGQKFYEKALKPSYAMNDFVLFRIAHTWPSGLAGWFPTSDDLLLADYSLSIDQAADLVAFSNERLSDGAFDAEWYLRVAILYYCDRGIPLHKEMVEALQDLLFLPASRKGSKIKRVQGRKKSDSLDRDRVIRNLLDGLILRGCNKTDATSITTGALGKVGIGLDQDAVRKIYKRTERTERELRLWNKMHENHTGSSGK